MCQSLLALFFAVFKLNFSFRVSIWRTWRNSFLAVTWQLNRWPCHSLTHWQQDTFEKHYHTALQETCEPWDIRWEWWGDMTWTTKIQWQRQWQRHSESTFKERFQRLVTFATFDQSDEETWPDQKERQLQWQIQRQRQWQRQIHLESTFKERS